MNGHVLQIFFSNGCASLWDHCTFEFGVAYHTKRAIGALDRASPNFVTLLSIYFDDGPKSFRKCCCDVIEDPQSSLLVRNSHLLVFWWPAKNSNKAGLFTYPSKDRLT